MVEKRKTRSSSSAPPSSPSSEAQAEELKLTQAEEQAEEQADSRALVVQKARAEASSQVNLYGNSANPLFLGAVISAEEMEAVRALLDGQSISKQPSFYGTNPKVAVKKEFGTVISPNLLGAAEVFAETNHPIYADMAAACAQRLPESVIRNMRAGVC